MDHDEQLWAGVLGMYSHVENRLGAMLQRRHGLGLSEYRALSHLAGADGGELRMTELADLLGLTQSTMTRLLGRLIAAGYADRDTCPEDKRGAYAVITAAGRAKQTKARPDYAETLTEALDTAEDSAPFLRALRVSR
ncbi:MarR family transcriptional regulator [Hamadaea sp.]|uniref:MarR family winged helix-turn-helix transcriptional regulator n=1 Tax=Hamadaea sp. TaxID=2024425 RepID=UPI0025BEBD94|nr:MarR family transcriptional regulator [Hamadaea sp.]